MTTTKPLNTNDSLRRSLCALVALCAAVFCATTLCLPLTLAQSVVPAAGATALTLNPQSPAPQAPFTARVDAYSYDIERARISWVVGGAARADLADRREVELVAPELGQPLTIEVRVTEAGGTAHTARRTFAPSAIDIIVEAETRTPHFYRGGALPSAGSPVRLVAQPSLYTAGGTLVTPSTIVYTWRIGTKVAASGRGRAMLETAMPRTGDLEVSVTAEVTDGSARHTSYERIRPAQPAVIFYEDNPLYGIARTALPTAFTLLDEEISVRAEPYFVSRSIFSAAQYDWQINNTVVANPNADPQVITLRKTGGEGAADVSFAIRNLNALLQAASGSFLMYFE